ncbi:hypothetical protein ACAG39_02140 [Caldicellulosiruptoraceae bacterium PP1]
MKNKIKNVFLMLVSAIMLIPARIFATNIGGTDVSGIIQAQDARSTLGNIIKNTIAPAAITIGAVGLVVTIVIVGFKIMAAGEARDRAEAIKSLGWKLVGALIVFFALTIAGGIMYFITQSSK